MPNARMHALLSSILKTIKPSKGERAQEHAFARRALLRIKSATTAKVTLTGSIAKDTFLKDKKDIDIFVLFKRDVPKSDLRSRVLDIAKKAFPLSPFLLSYAEHPYVRLTLEGRRIDIVPAYEIRSSRDLQSAVDRSVLHTRFIRRNLSVRRRDDVLLLKKFLRSAELYGAEIRVQGFSGYLCELLIIRYRGFVPLLRHASRWKFPVFIDCAGFYRKSRERRAISEKLKHPFIVIDPTDRNRNVAAAVSEENLKRFIARAKRFIANPSGRFFADPKTFEEKMAMLPNRYLITFAKPEVVDDVLWGQLRKLERQLRQFLEKHEFNARVLIDSDGLIRLVVSFKSDALPSTIFLRGPSTALREHVRAFKKSHPRARFIIKNKTMYARVPRRLVNPHMALAEFFKTAQLPSHLDKESVKINQVP